MLHNLNPLAVNCKGQLSLSLSLSLSHLLVSKGGQILHRKLHKTDTRVEREKKRCSLNLIQWKESRSLLAKMVAVETPKGEQREREGEKPAKWRSNLAIRLSDEERMSNE